MKSFFRDLLEAVIVWLLVLLMTISNLISPLDYIVKDALYQRPRGVSGDIKISGIDERTLEELGRSGTCARQYYADLLELLNADEASKPAVVGFDIIFSGNVDEAGDEAFVNAAKKSGNVVVASQLISCLNERHLRNNSTIITTNLSLEELRDRYSDRVFSRITSHYDLCKLTGPDIRMCKKRMQNASDN